MKKLSHKILSSKKTQFKSKLRRIIKEGKVYEYSRTLQDPLDAPYFADMIKALIDDAKFMDIGEEALSGIKSLHGKIKANYPNNIDFKYSDVKELIDEVVEEMGLDSQDAEDIEYYVEESWKSA